ncbi:MAG TPA: YaaC family protein, partial [Gaiellaceae bacterium]|nr:YaaC family protein [Gaiellaceae bacterium]
AHQPEALAFLDQAEDFYAAATSRFAANPLLTYYSFLNLGKAALRTLGFTGSLDRARHGLSEQTAPGGVELADSTVVVRDGGNAVNVFSELVDQLGFARPTNNQLLPVTELLPQVVVGHRIWKEAEPGNEERFVAIDEIEIVDDRATKNVWLRLYLARGDLSRYDITRRRLLDEGQLTGVFHEVAVKGTGRDPAVFLCLEQMAPVTYTGRPTDVLMDLVDTCRTRLWRIATSVPESGYRKYYIHMTPPGETARLPQLASLWALFYYFGSVVRYRPHLFDSITAGSYGAFVTEFVSAQAEQFLYLLASEMQAREVAKPAII